MGVYFSANDISAANILLSRRQTNCRLQTADCTGTRLDQEGSDPAALARLVCVRAEPEKADMH